MTLTRIKGYEYELNSCVAELLIFMRNDRHYQYRTEWLSPLPEFDYLSINYINKFTKNIARGAFDQFDWIPSIFAFEIDIFSSEFGAWQMNRSKRIREQQPKHALGLPSSGKFSVVVQLHGFEIAHTQTLYAKIYKVVPCTSV